MAGYLDHYGAGEERREKIIKTAAVALAILVVAAASFSSYFTITARSARSSGSSI